MNDNTDMLLKHVDQLYRELKMAAKRELKMAAKKATGREKQALDGNLLLKFARYYFQHQYEAAPLDSLFALMAQAPEKRGKTYTTNWQVIHETLKKRKHFLDKLEHKELAYILGWVAKLARAGV